MLYGDHLWAVYQMAAKQPGVEALYYKQMMEGNDLFLIVCHEPVFFFLQLDWVQAMGPFLHVEKEWSRGKQFHCRIIFQSGWECLFQFIAQRPSLDEDLRVLIDHHPIVYQEQSFKLDRMEQEKKANEFAKVAHNFYMHALVWVRHLKNGSPSTCLWRERELKKIYEQLNEKERRALREERIQWSQLTALLEWGDTLLDEVKRRQGPLPQEGQIFRLKELIRQLMGDGGS